MSEAPGSTTTPMKWPDTPPKKKYPCPDCDRSFDKPQGLGAHRSRAHGYRTNGTPPKATTPTIDATIEAIFPKGIPVDRKVMTAVIEFMESYDRLVKLAKK